MFKLGSSKFFLLGPLDLDTNERVIGMSSSLCSALPLSAVALRMGCLLFGCCWNRGLVFMSIWLSMPEGSYHDHLLS